MEGPKEGVNGRWSKRKQQLCWTLLALLNNVLFTSYRVALVNSEASKKKPDLYRSCIWGQSAMSVTPKVDSLVAKHNCYRVSISIDGHFRELRLEGTKESFSCMLLVRIGPQELFFFAVVAFTLFSRLLSIAPNLQRP